MDFFDQQDRARKRTSRLLFLFGLAVTVIFVLLYAGAAWVVTLVDAGRAVRSFDDPMWWWIPDLFVTLLIGHLAIVGLGSWLKIRELSEGGASVAQMLGGREVDMLTESVEERRLINVVEEMAIASGTPVPRVFVLEREWGMNAFAAGYGVDDAAVAVTRGGLKSWTRDELQGVVAHEFSHILNGDMRLNIRMIGILQGLVSIAAIGAMILRAGAHFGGFRGRSNTDRNGLAPALGLMAFGGFVYLVGWIGVLAGRIIRSGVSREREFLADASAVQFTRNPSGLAGALRKVGGAETGSEVEHPRAEEASHLFFGNAITARFLSGLFASHPPLKDRIRRLDPSFHGAFHRFDVQRDSDLTDVRLQPAPEHPIRGLTGAALPVAMVASAANPQAGTTGVGQPPSPEAWRKPGAMARGFGGQAQRSISADHLRYSGRVIEDMPHALLVAAHDPVGASAILYTLLLSGEESVRAEQLLHLSDSVNVSTTEAMARVEEALVNLAPQLKLPLVELTFPALKRMSMEQRRALLQRLDEIGSMEPALTVMRFALRKVVRRRLAGEARSQARVDFFTAGPLRGDMVFLLSVLCRVGTDDLRQQEQAFMAGLARIPMMQGVPASQLPPEACTFRALDTVLDRLAAAAPLIKRQVIDAATACVLFDEVVTLEEAELLRLVADVLGVAMPPFLPGGTETVDVPEDGRKASP